MRVIKNKIKIFSNRVQVSLKNDKFFLVDAEDLPLVRQSSWQYCGRPSRPDNVYVKGYIGGKSVALHRKIMEARTGEIVDHRNGKTWDNRRRNLRIVSASQNARNRKTWKGKDLPAGISRRTDNGRQAYAVRLVIDGKMRKMGYFKDLEEAKKRLIELKNLHYGEFSPHWGK